MSFAYNLCVALFKVITTIFFREVVERGTHYIPSTGPVIFVCAPHANQFVDPLILMTKCKRQVGFLIAAVSLKRWLVGLFARALGAIPVQRPQDLAFSCSGQIESHPTDPLKIIGIGTKFATELKAGHTLMTKSTSAIISSIESDFILTLVKPASFTCSTFKAAPTVDQSSLYENVYSILHEGGTIGIFPEGGSHDRSSLLPLKAGVAIMALGTAAKYPAIPPSAIKIIPVGLNYFHPEKFRSRVMVEFGRPIELQPEWVDDFRVGGEKKRAACSALMDVIFSSLLAVTVNVPDEETLQVIQTARRLYKPPIDHSSLDSFQMLELTRRFIAGYKKYGNDPRLIEATKKVLRYIKLLKEHGIRDHQVNRIRTGGLRALILLTTRLAFLAVLSVLALPGIILNFPAKLVIDSVSKKKAAEAKAKSDVKLYGRDVLATWKLMIGWILIPSLHIFYTILFAIAVQHKWISVSPVFAHPLSLIALLFILPIVCYGTIIFQETQAQLSSSIRALFMSLTYPEDGKELVKLRQELKTTVVQIVNFFGPEMIPNFATERLVRYRNTPSHTPSGSINGNGNGGGGGNGDEIDYLMSGMGMLKERIVEGVSFSLDLDWGSVDKDEIDDIFFTQ